MLKSLPRAVLALALSSALALPVVAQTSAAAPSTSAMVNLVRALVAKGTLSAAEGQALLQQAEAEAAKAQASTVPPGTVRVPYVPESVRAQIRDELKEDVLQTAKAEGWAQPGKVQDWVGKIKLFGDFRYRGEFQFYGRGNDGGIIDFNAFNANGPTEINSAQSGYAPPLINSTRDRANRENIRLRFGLTADVSDAVKLTLRLATGDNNGPVSTNSTLGGGFAKKNIYVDRAYVDLTPTTGVTLTGGRMPNPFVNNVLVYDDLVWDPDVNFDGIAARLDSGDRFGEKLTVRATGGAFPLEYGNPSFRTTLNDTPRSSNKWLYAAQLVGDWRFRHDIGVRASAAYYYFDNVQGQVSDPCETSITGGTNVVLACSTDPLRPAFLQKGNTVFALRNLVPDPRSPTNFSQRQFAGLTFAFQELDLKTDVTIKLDEKKVAVVGGEYVKNLAFKRRDICKAVAGFGGTAATSRGPINNVGTVVDAQGNPVTVPNPADPTTRVPITPCADLTPYNAKIPFEGGDTAWTIRATIGYPEVKQFGQWNVSGGYKYIETDAILDQFADSDFHLGGTNAQGYYIAGTLGLFDGVSGRARWLSANEISGPPLAIDVLQLDLLVAF